MIFYLRVTFFYIMLSKKKGQGRYFSSSGMVLGMALFLENMENSHFSEKCGNLKIPVIAGSCVN